MKKIKQFFKDIWLGITVASQNYLNGRTNQGKF